MTLIIDRRAGNPGALGELELGNSEAVEKLLFEDVPGRGGKDGFLFSDRGPITHRVNQHSKMILLSMILPKLSLSSRP